MKKKFFVEIVSLLFIILFTYSALSKLADYSKFRVQLGQSPLLTSIAGFIAWTIPALEIGIAILLSISKYRFTALLASFSLMALFTAYIEAITHFSDYIPCSCGGVLQNMGWNTHLAFNIIFLALGAAGFLCLEKINNKKTTRITDTSKALLQ